METNILLESGTNELEILEFCVGGNRKPSPPTKYSFKHRTDQRYR